MHSDLTPDRLLVLAPHPDDEAIGAGTLIQRVVARGGAVRIVFLTDGDQNPWPQRFMNRRWSVSGPDRIAWGELRRREAIASLATLGVSAEDASFLGLPDQKLAELARTGDPRLLDAIRAAVRDFQPSLLVVPSAQDLHADHRAAAWFAHHAVRGLGDVAPEIVTYVVHGDGSPQRLHVTLDLTAEERSRKRDAIACHRTQLLLSRERFLAYAAATERFYSAEFDLVCTESRAQERMTALRHSCRVLLGRAKPREA
ncbi:MAG: putative LmbE-like protein [Acidobacteria bacterium]|nr:putative LmbE-like protein [Acidobacteriota bacterium]